MERSMEAIVACCAGLDVHQAGVVACLNRGGKRGGKEIRSFGTTRGELAEMCAWLRAGGCTLVAMESTGVYWHCFGSFFVSVDAVCVFHFRYEIRILLIFLKKC